MIAYIFRQPYICHRCVVTQKHCINISCYVNTVRYIVCNKIYDYLEEVIAGSHEVSSVFCFDFGLGCERIEQLLEMREDDVSVS